MGSRTFEQAWNDRLPSAPTVDHCHLLRDGDFEVINVNLDCSSASGCWIWKGKMYKTRKCPPFYVGGSKDVQLHRLLYHNFRGPLPDQAGVPNKDKLCVLHCCKEVADVDNSQLCCNPYHLKLGTKKENTADLLAGNDGEAVHISILNRQERLIKPKEAKRMADEIELDRRAGQQYGVKHIVEKFKISSRGNFYKRVNPFLKVKGIEFHYNAPGRSVQQLPDDFFDDGVRKIIEDYNSDQLRPTTYYFGAKGPFGRKIGVQTFYKRVVRPRLPVEIQDEFSKRKPTAKFPPIEDDRRLEIAKVMSRFDVWLSVRRIRISAPKSLIQPGRNLLKKLPTRTSKMYSFADLRCSKRSLSSSVRDTSLNDPLCQRVSRSRLMSASTKKTRRPKPKACSKMLPTTRVMRSLDLL